MLSNPFTRTSRKNPTSARCANRVETDILFHGCSPSDAWVRRQIREPYFHLIGEQPPSVSMKETSVSIRREGKRVWRGSAPLIQRSLPSLSVSGRQPPNAWCSRLDPFPSGSIALRAERLPSSGPDRCFPFHRWKWMRGRLVKLKDRNTPRMIRPGRTGERRYRLWEIRRRCGDGDAMTRCASTAVRLAVVKCGRKPGSAAACARRGDPVRRGA